MLRLADALLIPFSLVWGGFAIFWEVSVVNSRAPFFFSLWGVPFILIGLYLIAGRFFADAYQRQRTFYAVTSERVIIISGFFKDSVKSINVKAVSDISLSEKKRWNRDNHVRSRKPICLVCIVRLAWRSATSVASFEGILSARTVYETIRQVQKAVG